MTGRDSDRRRAALANTTPFGVGAQASPLRPGAAFGPYTIISELGRGGMGVVYRARDAEGCEVALKTILAARLEQESDAAKVRDRFMREARIALRINHPRVIRSLDTGEVEGTLFLTCALLNGRSLRAVLGRRQRLPEAEALSVLHDGLSGLAELHRLGLVHRDIKPDNLLLGSDGGLVVCDLGLACSTEPSATRLTRTGEVFGSPAYMAPELVEGDRVIDIRSDLYALGIVLYECLCGEVPFRGRSPTAIWRQHISSPLPDPRDDGAEVSPQTVALLHRLLAKSSDHRPAEPLVVLSEFEASLPPRRPLSPWSAAVEPPTAPRSRLRLESEGSAERRILYAYAQPCLQLGRNAVDYQGQDVCLRLEPGEAFREQNRRISGRHLAVSIRAGRAWVEDLGSAHGSRLDGAPLEAGEPAPLPVRGELVIAGGLRLQVSVQRRRGLPSAILLERLNNRPELAYALIVDRLDWPLAAGEEAGACLIVGSKDGEISWRFDEDDATSRFGVGDEVSLAGGPSVRSFRF